MPDLGKSGAGCCRMSHANQTFRSPLPVPDLVAVFHHMLPILAAVYEHLRVSGLNTAAAALAKEAGLPRVMASLAAIGAIAALPPSTPAPQNLLTNSPSPFQFGAAAGHGQSVSLTPALDLAGGTAAVQLGLYRPTTPTPVLPAPSTAVPLGMSRGHSGPLPGAGAAAQAVQLAVPGSTAGTTATPGIGAPLFMTPLPPGARGVPATPGPAAINTITATPGTTITRPKAVKPMHVSAQLLGAHAGVLHTTAVPGSARQVDQLPVLPTETLRAHNGPAGTISARGSGYAQAVPATAQPSSRKRKAADGQASVPHPLSRLQPRASPAPVTAVTDAAGAVTATDTNGPGVEAKGPALSATAPISTGPSLLTPAAVTAQPAPQNTQLPAVLGTNMPAGAQPTVNAQPPPPPFPLLPSLSLQSPSPTTIPFLHSIPALFASEIGRSQSPSLVPAPTDAEYAARLATMHAANAAWGVGGGAATPLPFASPPTGRKTPPPVPGLGFEPVTCAGALAAASSLVAAGGAATGVRPSEQGTGSRALVGAGLGSGSASIHGQSSNGNPLLVDLPNASGRGVVKGTLVVAGAGCERSMEADGRSTPAPTARRLSGGAPATAASTTRRLARLCGAGGLETADAQPTVTDTSNALTQLNQVQDVSATAGQLGQQLGRRGKLAPHVEAACREVAVVAGLQAPSKLNSIVMSYLRQQHRQACMQPHAIPVAVLPPVPLSKQYQLPTATRASDAPANAAARMARRELVGVHGGRCGARGDRHFVYSR